MTPFLKEALKVVGIIIGFVLAVLLGIWSFTNFPTISWIVFVVLLVGGGLIITGAFGSVYRKITGK